MKYIKTFCWVLLLATFSCQGDKHTADDTPDAVRDLLIDRSFWKKSVVSRPQDKAANIHRLTITNTSHHYVYQHIEIRFDYYDRDHRKLDESIRTVERTIEPRAAIKVDSIQTNLAKEGTTSATATIVKASVE